MKIVLTEVYSPQTRIANIKALRAANPGMGLKEANEAVEAVQRGDRVTLWVTDPDPLIGYIAYEVADWSGFPSIYDSSYNCNNPMPCPNPDHRVTVEDKAYVARVTATGSTTVYTRVLSGGEVGQEARRDVMQEAIDGGYVTEGEYIVAAPFGACLNASRFTIERIEHPQYKIV